MSKLIVHQPPGGWGEPSISPFSIELECYRRIAEIAVGVCPADLRNAPAGQDPLRELDGVPVGESRLIIDELTARYGDRT